MCRPIELTTEPDGILKGYSAVLELSLSWDEGWPRFYAPATGEYRDNWRAERAARQAADAGIAALQSENELLRRQLRSRETE